MNAFKNAVERLRAKTERTIGISELDRGDAQALIVQFDHDGQEIERLKARVAELEEKWSHATATAERVTALTERATACIGGFPVETVSEAVERVVKERDALRARVAELEAWQLTVAEATGYVNRPEGQAGYEVADADTVAGAIERWRQEAAK